MLYAGQLTCIDILQGRESQALLRNAEVVDVESPVEQLLTQGSARLPKFYRLWWVRLDIQPKRAKFRSSFSNSPSPTLVIVLVFSLYFIPEWLKLTNCVINEARNTRLHTKGLKTVLAYAHCSQPVPLYHTSICEAQMAGAGKKVSRPREIEVVSLRVVRPSMVQLQLIHQQEIVPEQVASGHQMHVEVLARSRQIVGVYGMREKADDRVKDFDIEREQIRRHPGCSTFLLLFGEE